MTICEDHTTSRTDITRRICCRVVRVRTRKRVVINLSRQVLDCIYDALEAKLALESETKPLQRQTSEYSLPGDLPPSYGVLSAHSSPLLHLFATPPNHQSDCSR